MEFEAKRDTSELYPFINSCDEKFIIEIDSLRSSELSTPAYTRLSPPVTEAHFSGVDRECFSFPRTTRLEALLNDYRESFDYELEEWLQTKCEREVISYLRHNPVTLSDVELLVPEWNVKPFTLMNKLATNIGYFHACGDITASELEEIYIYLISQGNKGINVVFEKIKTNVKRFEREFRTDEKVAAEVAAEKATAEATAQLERFALQRLESATILWQIQSSRSTTKPSSEILFEIEDQRPKICFPRECGNFEGPSEAPMEEEMNMHKGVEKQHLWAKTKSLPQWLWQKKKERPQVQLPLQKSSKEKGNRARFAVVSQDWYGRVVLPLRPSSYLAYG